MAAKATDSASSDARTQHVIPSATDPAAFLAEDAAEQTAKLDALLATVPLDQHPAVLNAYILGQSAAALPFFARGMEAGRAMACDTPDATATSPARLRLVSGGAA